MNKNDFYLYTYLASAGIYTIYGIYYSLSSGVAKNMATQETLMFVLACGFLGLCLGLFGTWIYNSFFCRSYNANSFFMSILTPFIILLIVMTVFGVIAVIVAIIILRRRRQFL